MRYKRVTIRIAGERPDIIDSVKPAFDGKLVRDATLLYPKQFASYPDVPADKWSEEVRSLLLKQQYVLLVELAEEGGGMTRTGYAYVVCGEQGQPTRPFRIPKGYSLGEHAYFCGRSLIQVRATRQEEVCIMRVTPIDHIADGWVAVRDETIWSGYADELPHLYEHFSRAMKAAVEKARCYHCRHVHYVNEG